MKMRVFILLAVFLTARCFGQGILNFANIAVDVNAPVRDASLPGMPLCSGPGYLAQLYWGSAGTSDPNVLATNGVSGAPASFATGIYAGYFAGLARRIDGAFGGVTITAQVRAWRADSGASWETALVRGESNLVQVTLQTPPGAPLNLIGLQPFNLYAVPEPGGWVLLALGSMAFWCGARKRHMGTTRVNPESSVYCTTAR